MKFSRILTAALLPFLCSGPAWAATTNAPGIRTNILGSPSSSLGDSHVLVNRTTGVITSPTNFWSANSNTLAEAVALAAAGITTTTNASLLTAGTLPDARLASLIPRLGGGTTLTNPVASSNLTGTLPDASLSSLIPRLGGGTTLTNPVASSNLTGALPALDGSALTGVQAATTLTNWYSFTGNNVLAEEGGGATVVDRTDAYRIDWPVYNGGTTVGAAKWWVPRRVIRCQDTNVSYKIYGDVPNHITRGKTNVVVMQYFYTTNTAIWSAGCGVAYVSLDAAVRWQGGALGNNQTNTVATNPYMVTATNAYSLHTTCTNGLWSFWLGRPHPSIESFAGPIPTNTVWWAGADLYFY